MDVPDPLAGAMVIALAAALLYIAWLRRARAAARAKAAELDTKKRSQSARYGSLSEQFAPWMRGWPFDPAGFRFVGKPIDGIQFTEGAIYIVEIKAASSARSPVQEAIRRAVMEGRVGWLQFNISEDRPAEIVKPWEEARRAEPVAASRRRPSP
ncbi:MAG: Holliday junction resolvase-like protein [Thermoplasmatota archaeon]